MTINASKPKFQFDKLEQTILSRLGFVKKGKDFVFKKADNYIHIECDIESGDILLHYSSSNTNFEELENYDEASDIVNLIDILIQKYTFVFDN